MHAVSLAETNRKNRAFWQEQCAKQDQLLKKKYIRHFIKSQFCDPTGSSHSVEPDKLYEQLSFYAQLCHRKNEFSKWQAERAREPRRKAAGDSRSRRQLISDFASSPAMISRRTKSLIAPFFEYLKSLGLNPIRADDSCEYDGRRDRISITDRQFVKLVSEVAPRRKKR